MPQLTSGLQRQNPEHRRKNRQISAGLRRPEPLHRRPNVPAAPTMRVKEATNPKPLIRRRLQLRGVVVQQNLLPAPIPAARVLPRVLKKIDERLTGGTAVRISN